MKTRPVQHLQLFSRKIEKDANEQINKVRKEMKSNVSLAILNGRTSFEVLKNELQAKIKGVKSWVELQFQNSAKRFRLKTSKEKLEDLILKLTPKIQELARIETGYLIDLERNTPDYPIRNKNWVLALIAVPILADAVVLGQAFQVYATNNLSALGMALGSTLLLGVTAHAIGRKAQSTSGWKRRLYVLAGLFGATIFFSMVALFRQEQFEGSTWVSHPALFVIMNLFFYSCAVYISYMYYPTKEQEDEHRKYKQTLNKYKATKQERLELEQQIEEQTEEHHALVLTEGEILEYEVKLINKVLKEGDAILAEMEADFVMKGGQTSNNHLPESKTKKHENN